MPYLRWLETTRTHASRPAIFDGDQTITFGQLAHRVALAPRATAPVIARGGGSGFFVEILRAWRDGQAVIPIERDAVEPALSRPPPAGTCLVKYTPGASGIPRGIFLNASQVMADGDRLTAAMGLTPAAPNLAAISLAHSYGFSNVVLPMILHGVPVHLAPVPFPRAIEEIFACHRQMTVPVVPSIWRAWHRSGILRGAPVRLAVSAGAPLSLALEGEVFADSGLKIHNFYGTSECGGISFDASKTPRQCGDDVGTPLPGVCVGIHPDGRLRITSDAVAMAYDSPRDDDLLGDGRYLTRDLGWIGEAGEIHLTGTLGGAINVSGRKVSPAKVEAALLATGCLLRVRVFGVASADLERFSEIGAEVVLRPEATLESLKAEAMGRLQGWELPRHWTLVPG